MFERDRVRLLDNLVKDENGKQIIRNKKKSFEEFIAHPAVVAYCDERSDAYLLNEIAGIDLTNTTKAARGRIEAAAETVGRETA